MTRHVAHMPGQRHRLAVFAICLSLLVPCAWGSLAVGTASVAEAQEAPGLLAQRGRRENRRRARRNTRRRTRENADLVNVRIREIAGGQAYIEPGEASGVRRGGVVVFGDTRVNIVASTNEFAVVTLPRGGGLSEGQTGKTKRMAPEPDDAKRLPTPTPVDEFRGQWGPAEPPGETEVPERFVPLGDHVKIEKRGMLRGLLRGEGLVHLPIREGAAEPLGMAGVRAQVQFVPFENLPLSVDTDVAFQLWFAQDQLQGNKSRPPAVIRQFELRYGDQGDLFASLGRLAHASTLVGALDGLRVDAPSIYGVTVGAFGGVVPHPYNTLPSTEAARFGAHVMYRDDESALHPMADVAVFGSSFDGNVDERRIRASAQVFPGASRIAAALEIALFDADNPWNADTVELSGFSVDSQIRLGDIGLPENLRAHARFDVQKTDRSLYMESVYQDLLQDPAATLCYDGCPVRYTIQGGMGYDLDPLLLDVGASVMQTGETQVLVDELNHIGGYAQGRISDLPLGMRMTLGLDGSFNDMLRAFGARFQFDLPLDAEGTTQVFAHYRPSLMQYRAAVADDIGGASFVQHSMGAGATWLVTPRFSIMSNFDAFAGRDVNALLVQLGANFRL